MKEIRKKIHDEFYQVRIDTMDQVFKVMIIYIYILAMIANVLGLGSAREKWMVSIVFTIGTCINIGLLLMINKKVKSAKLKMGLYVGVSILLTVITALSSPGRYLTTVGTALGTYTVITFFVLSKKMLYLQGGITIILMAVISLSGVDNTVVLGYGYPAIVIGIYILHIYALSKGISMFDKFELIYNNQLADMHGMNEELTALNEEYQAVEQTLLYRLDHDDLTQALNWNGFHLKINQMMKVDQNFDFYVVLFDLDNFKYINNSMGYSMGDRILTKIMDVFRAYGPPIENLARAEGNTMMFTVESNISHEGVIKEINHVLENIKVDGFNFKLTATVGIAQARDAYNGADLINNAEMAMHKAKEESKGSMALHDPAYQNKMDRYYKIMNHLPSAIEKKEFYNLYQPKIEIENGQLVGFEALVRWQSIELGMVYPDEFIAVAEQTGQIINLGYYIMEQAMIFAKKAVMHNPDVVVSINLSPRQILDDEFITKTREYIEKTQVQVKNVAFEITETAYIENIDRVTSILDDLKEMGIAIYLDDFGTGYSSLSYLHKLPIQTLKIDKSFIDAIHESTQARDLVSSLMTLAQVLELDTIAEGVETLEQLSILRSLNCQSVQGYYFDRPLLEPQAIKAFDKKYSVE